MIYAGVNGTPRTAGLQTRYGDFGPRIGFAFDPIGNGKTVIRAGYGLVRFPLPPGASEELGVQVPWLVSQSYSPAEYPVGTDMDSVPTIADPFGPPVMVQPTNTAELNADNPYVLARDTRNLTPYMETYTLDVQRQVTPNTLLQIGYAGSRGIHLLEAMNLNEVEPGPGSLASRRLIQPLNNVSTIYYMWNGNMSNYNSLQVKAERNMSRGMQFLVDYTYSKSLDYNVSVDSGGGMVSSPQTITKMKAGYGLSGFDLTHRFVASWIYQLPFGPGHQLASTGVLGHVVGGWEFSTIDTLESGVPFSVNLATGVNNGATSWPNQICSGKLPHPSPAAWFNTSCFVPPPANTYGDVSRTPLRGPGTIDFDTALAKAFPIKEKLHLVFRAEGFNILNTSNFYLRANGDFGQIGLPDANAITGTFIDNREFQMSLKLTF
jgi:hypothetical protein